MRLPLACVSAIREDWKGWAVFVDCSQGVVLGELLVGCLSLCRISVISVNNGISVLMCLAGFPAARRCHSCVQIKNGKGSK